MKWLRWRDCAVKDQISFATPVNRIYDDMKNPAFCGMARESL